MLLCTEGSEGQVRGAVRGGPSIVPGAVNEMKTIWGSLGSALLVFGRGRQEGRDGSFVTLKIGLYPGLLLFPPTLCLPSCLPPSPLSSFPLFSLSPFPSPTFSASIRQAPILRQVPYWLWRTKRDTTQSPSARGSQSHRKDEPKTGSYCTGYGDRQGSTRELRGCSNCWLF